LPPLPSRLLRAAACFLLTLAASAQQPSNSPKISPDSRYIQEMLLGPLSRDVDELVLQAQILKMAGEEDKGRALLAIAERLLLNGIVKMPVGALPATLGEAITNEQAQSPVLRDWQKSAIERSITWVPRPRGSDPRVQGFRNDTDVPLTYFQAAFVVEGKVLQYCGYPIGSPELAPHAIGMETCGKSESMPVPADLHAQLEDRPGNPPPFFRVTQISFAPGGYKIGTARGSFADASDEARRVLARLPAELLLVPGPAKPEPIPKAAQQNRRALMITTLASLAAGFVLGLLAGAVSRRPWRAYGVLLVLAGIAAVVALGAFMSQYAGGGWGGNIIVAMAALIVVGSHVLLAAIVIAWFWTCFAVAAAIGTRLTRRKATIARAP
jgi:hypothetical protein